MALAPLSVQVGLPTHLRSSLPFLADSSRLQAELFEAYVAAFEQELGYAAMYDWLKALFKPLVTKLIHAPPPTKPALVPAKAAKLYAAKPALAVQENPQDSYNKLRAYFNGTGRRVLSKFKKSGGVTTCMLVCDDLVASGQGIGNDGASIV